MRAFFRVFLKQCRNLPIKKIDKHNGFNTVQTERFDMHKYKCEVCGYVYDPSVGDPDNGVGAGTPFEKLPEDWVCPVCGVGKDSFAKVEK